jgi:hypothetical protein
MLVDDLRIFRQSEYMLRGYVCLDLGASVKDKIVWIIISAKHPIPCAQLITFYRRFQSTPRTYAGNDREYLAQSIPRLL